MDTPARLAKETSEVCEELDYELITDEPDWQDWRLEEDGVVKTVSINLEDNSVSVEIIDADGDQEFFKEYSEDENNTAREVKRKL